MYSTNNGKSFSTAKRISHDNWMLDGCPHTGPAIAGNSLGIHFAWYTQGNGAGIFYCNAESGSNDFTKRDAISTNILARHPQSVALANDHIAIVWDESSPLVDSQSQIGLQLRDKKGRIIHSEMIGSEEKSYIYPVLKCLTGNKILLAYTSTNYEHANVEYKIIEAENLK
jgi:hypothetical protein